MKLIFNGIANERFKVDPRTKILILFLISTFVFAGLGGNREIMNIIRPVLVGIPLVLMLLIKRVKAVVACGTMYFIFYLAQSFMGSVTGLANFILLFTISFFIRIMPGIISAYYLTTTTTISELVAAMNRMKLSDKIIIPLTVIFRFFPTVIEEANSVSVAMKMRGIYFGGKNPSKIVEYRLIPMITCSVKAGEELSASALSRGLGSPVKRTNLCDIGFNVVDYMIFGTLVFLGILYISF